MEGDQESPTSSPAPGQQPAPEPEEEVGGEAEAFPAPGPLGLPHNYRYLPAEPSPAPSASGLDGDYSLNTSHQEASISFTRQFDVLSGASASTSASSSCPSSSSSVAFSQPSSHHNSLPGPSGSHRSQGPGSSDPVFSAHSGPLQNDLLPFPSNARPSSAWDQRPDLPISSSWSSEGPSAEPSDWDRSQLGPPAGWARAGDWEPSSLPGPSGMEQAVPEQLSLDREEDQDSRDLEWSASSSGLEPRHMDYSEENSLESEVQQSFSQYAGIEATGFSPQPSSSASAVSGSIFGAPVSPLDPNLSSVAQYSPAPTYSGKQGPSSAAPQPAPASSNGSEEPSQEASNAEPEEIPLDDHLGAHKVTSAKRSISFPDSPTSGGEPSKRPRRHLEEDRADSPSEPQKGQSFSNGSHAELFLPEPGPSQGSSRPYSQSQARYSSYHGRPRRGVRTLNAHIDDGEEASGSGGSGVSNSIPTHEVISIDIPESVPGPSGSMSSQIRAEIENCLREGEAGSSGGVDQSHSHDAGPSLPQSVESPNPNSPTGSEASAAGPSHAYDEIPLELHHGNSPSGSDAEAAVPSHPLPAYPQAVPGPNSPTPSDHPSESDAEEAGPSQGPSHAPAPRSYHGAGPSSGGYHGWRQEREAAPAIRLPSPPVTRRRNVMEECGISSSTGPVDSNPPTPEMYHVGRDIDNDMSLPSPPRHHASPHDEEDCGVDSTVDSTSHLPFLLNSPSDYRGSEAEAEGESSDGEDGEDDASVAGSEASSTTNASLDQALSFPGQDDNEGISTSGQVDDGRFRLVPNDAEFPLAAQPSGSSGGSQQNVPDMVEGLREDDLEEPRQGPGVKPVFKKPYNRKGRLLDSYSFSDDNDAGPSEAGPSGAGPVHFSTGVADPRAEVGLGLFSSGVTDARAHFSSGSIDPRTAAGPSSFSSEASDTRAGAGSSNFTSEVTDARAHFSSDVNNTRASAGPSNFSAAASDGRAGLGPSHLSSRVTDAQAHFSSGVTDARSSTIPSNYSVRVTPARAEAGSSHFSSGVPDARANFQSGASGTRSAARTSHFSSGVTDARSGSSQFPVEVPDARAGAGPSNFSSGGTGPGEANARTAAGPALISSRAGADVSYFSLEDRAGAGPSQSSLGVPIPRSGAEHVFFSSGVTDARNSSEALSKARGAASTQSQSKVNGRARHLNVAPHVPGDVGPSHFLPVVTDSNIGRSQSSFSSMLSEAQVVTTRPNALSRSSNSHEAAGSSLIPSNSQGGSLGYPTEVTRYSNNYSSSVGSSNFSSGETDARLSHGGPRAELGPTYSSQSRYGRYTSYPPNGPSGYPNFSSGITDARYPQTQPEGSRGQGVSSTSSSTSITMSILTSSSTTRSSPAYSAVSLFPVQQGSNERAPRIQQSPFQHYSEAGLGLGMAFSGLPGSVSLDRVAREESEGDQGPGDISGPLSKRLRTRHFQEQAKASQGTGDQHTRAPENNTLEQRSVQLPGTGSEILRNSLEGKVRLPRPSPPQPHDPRMQRPVPQHETRSNNQSLASLMAAPPLVENVLINLQTGRLEPDASAGESSSSGSQSTVQQPAASPEQQDVLFLGATQQTYSLNLEPSSLNLSAVKSKRLLQAKSSAESQQQGWVEGGEASFVQPPVTSILKTELEARPNSNRENTFQYISPKKRTLEYVQNHSIETGPISIDPEPVKTPEPQEVSKEDSNSNEDATPEENDPSPHLEGEVVEEVLPISEVVEEPLTIGDAPVASRAVASLPSHYLGLRDLEGGQQGVFVQRTVPLSCRFGPMEGRLVDAAEDLNSTFPLCLISQGHRLDVSSEDESNWMRFIQPARNLEEQNLILTEVDGSLFFTTNRVVNVGEELKVWYSEQYAVQHGLSQVPTPAPPPEATNRPKKNVDRHKNTRSFSVNVARENIAERSIPNGAPSYNCDICGRKFERQASLARHLALHKGDKSYSCPDCGQKFSHTFNLERHRKKVHHSDPSGQHVRCSNCGIWFPSSMVLKVHMFSHHPNKEEQNWTVEDAMAQSGKEGSQQSVEEMKFQCPSEGCGCQYDTWLELVEHAADHGTPCLPFDNPDLLATGPIHKCELCYKTFASDVRLKKHMAVHAGDETKPLECDICGKRFLTNSALAGHVKIHVNPDTLYDCPICLQEFEQVSSLKEHVYVHKEGGNFTCPHCQKTFTEYPNIRKHIRSFHAEKRFSCTVCTKSFTGRDKLKIHMVRHSEAKDFMCDDCGKQFKRKDKLREHGKRMHNVLSKKERPVVVPTDHPADKFTPKVSPTELHRFIYKCTSCMLGFKRRGMLVNHMAKRHPEIPFNAVPELNLPILKTTKDFYCQYCEKVYKSSSKRKNHILKIHPGAALPAGAREVNSGHAEAEASTFSHTVGSVTTQPHNCELCHKQYASKAKLLQHLRKKHRDQAAPSTSRGSQAARPAKVLYIDPLSPTLPQQMIEEEDEEAEDQPGEMGMEWEGGEGNLFPEEDFLLADDVIHIAENRIKLSSAGRGPGGDLLTQALSLTDMPPSSSRKEGLLSPRYATLQPAVAGERGEQGRAGDGMLEQLLARPPGPSSHM